MSNYSHFSALIKKNLLISKSTFVLTIVELFSPIVIMLLLWGLKTLFTKANLEFQDDVDYLVSNSSLLTNTFNPIILDEISYRGYIYMCSNRPLIAFVGENFPENLAKKVKDHKWEFRFVKFQNFNNLEDLLDYVESKEYGADNELYPKLCFALSYKNEANKYQLKLHYFANPYRSNPPDIPSTEIGVGDPLNLQPDFNSFGKYIQSGFFMSQKVFYDYVLQKETNTPDAQITYSICPKKYDKFINDAFVRNISLLLCFFTIVAYALPLTINIYRIVKEKETRAKEGMKIMGLSELTYFLSYFVIYFIINLFYSIVNALILKNVLTNIEFFYIFLLYFLYGLVIYSLIYFFQSFLERTRIAIIVSLLIYSLMFFLFIPVSPSNVAKALKVIFCILFPPVALQLGIDTISAFEENFNKFNGRIYFQYNKISVCEMYIFFSVSFIIYMFLGFYFQNILSHEYGIKKPWNFLCTKNFWGCENNKKGIDIDDDTQNQNINNIKLYDMKENNKKNDNSLDSKNDKENINKDAKNQSNGRQIKNIKFMKIN